MSFRDTFKALSDDTRREILTLLRAGPLSAGEIGSHFSLSAATLSHHLAILRGADLISDRREGKFIYYELNTSVLDDVLVWLKGLSPKEDEE